MRVHVVDPAAATPPYDRALCAALARAGADVELWTSRFPYGAVPPAAGYAVREAFHRAARGPAGSRRRLALKLATHVPDMLRHRRAAAAGADVVHYQWLAVQPVDGALLARRPRVLTAHDVLPREPRPGQRAAQRRLYARMDAVVAHSLHGAGRLREEAGVDPGRIHVIPHGAFTHLPAGGALPPELPVTDRPVALCFGLIRPYKGLDVLLEAWRAAAPAAAELWVVGRARGVDTAALRASAPPGVRWVERFVTDAETRALFERADLVVLPYREIEQSGVLFTALGLGRPLLVTAVGGFPEIAAAGAARLVPPGDPAALAGALDDLLGDAAARGRLAAAARAARDGAWSWDAVARSTLDLYERLLRGSCA